MPLSARRFLLLTLVPVDTVLEPGDVLIAVGNREQLYRFEMLASGGAAPAPPA